MNQVEQARKSLLNIALREIRDISSHSDYYTHIFCVIAKLGLQLKAKEERFFENAEWNNEQSREIIFERLRAFLTKYIR